MSRMANEERGVVNEKGGRRGMHAKWRGARSRKFWKLLLKIVYFLIYLLFIEGF